MNLLFDLQKVRFFALMNLSYILIYLVIVLIGWNFLISSFEHKQRCVATYTLHSYDMNNFHFIFVFRCGQNPPGDKIREQNFCECVIWCKLCWNLMYIGMHIWWNVTSFLSVPILSLVRMKSTVEVSIFFTYT